MTANKPRKSSMRAFLSSLAALGGIAVLAGCGGSSTSAGGQQGHGTPLQSNADRVQVGPPVQKGRAIQATSKDDQSKISPTRLNPCKLVSLSEAQAITGGTIASRVEAPLGPTCIYQRSGSKGEITVTVESMNTPMIRRQMGTLQRLSVSGRSGYCGRLGTEMLFVPLATGRLLHITAPCAIAQQFAARALPRIAA